MTELLPTDPPLTDPTPTPLASKQRRYILWSVITLFVAILTIAAALILRSREGGGDRPQPGRFVQPVGQTDDETRRPATPVPADQSKRIATHLARAKRHMRVKNWRAALFFVDQVLILSPTHAEAQRLLATVEEGMKEQDRAALARARARRRARLAAAQARARAARAEKKAETKAEKKPEPGRDATVSVLSSPPSTVYIDGVRLGKTPLEQMSLAPGRHALKLIENGYREYIKEFQLEPGQKQTIDVKLQPVADGKPEPTKTVEAKPRIPKLKLARTVKVLVHSVGKKQPALSQTLGQIERAVTRAIGKPAAGSTRPLSRFLSTSRRDAETPITLHPRTMGYLIADALLRGQKNIGPWLLQMYRSGRIDALAARGWRPK